MNGLENLVDSMRYSKSLLNLTIKLKCSIKRTNRTLELRCTMIRHSSKSWRTVLLKVI